MDTVLIRANVYVCAQLYLILCDLRDCSPPGSPVHRISQARILEWVTISSSRVSSDLTQVLNLSLLNIRRGSGSNLRSTASELGELLKAT